MRRNQKGRAEAKLRGGFEPKIKAQLENAKVNFAYEPIRIPYVIPEQTHYYLPDWVLLDNGIVVETKGYPFDAADRKKILLVRAQHPDLDLRLVFSSSNIKIYPGSKTTVADWASREGIPHAEKRIPDEWLFEPPRVSSVTALQRLMTSKTTKKP